jgi:drug/metabolite transporter (DMT)-like permease
MLAIALALGASICWGSGDFLGGLTTRRASLWAVLMGSQAVGLTGIVLVTVLTGHGWPGLHAVWPVLLGGAASVVAISCFYKALAIGSMSIVAPISATSAAVPFVVGILGGERPSPTQLAGVALAAVGVLVVASQPVHAGQAIGVAALPNEPAIAPRPPDHHASPADHRKAIVLAAIASLSIGLVLVAYNATARYDPLWALLGCRASSAILFATLFLVLRPPVKVGRSALPFIVAVGVLDTTANGLFAIATTQGYLSLVSVVGAVYPVVTILLAFALLRERIARRQMAGVVATMIGIALIAAG